MKSRNSFVATGKSLQSFANLVKILQNIQNLYTISGVLKRILIIFEDLKKPQKSSTRNLQVSKKTYRQFSWQSQISLKTQKCYEILEKVSNSLQKDLECLLTSMAKRFRLSLSNKVLTKLLLYGDEKFSDNLSRNILSLTLKSIHKTGRLA